MFAELERKRAEAQARGVDVISFGIGDPDLPSPEGVVEEVVRQAGRPENHRYPSYEGLLSFREAMAAYYERRFGVKVDPHTQVMTCIGSKEGLAHLLWALVDPGDVVLVPDPAYPVYATHAVLAGGSAHYLPLRAERGFLPDLSSVPTDVARRARALFLNYPNNPTGAVAPLSFFQEAVEFARTYDLLLVHDAAYVEMTFDGHRAPSVLQVPGALDVAVEFYSLSKPFNMTGWRLAACVGNEEAVRALGIIKTNTDSGQWNAVQRAGEYALRSEAESFIARMNRIYQERRDLLVDGLRALGWEVPRPAGTFYVWAPVPEGWTSLELATVLLEEAGVLVTPGSGYGPAGEGYVRLCLTLPTERIREALGRLARVNLRVPRSAR